MAPEIDRLRPTQSVVAPHLCIEQRVVLQADGYLVKPSPIGWVVRKV